MKTKRFFALLLALIISMACLTGCRDKKPEELEQDVVEEKKKVPIGQLIEEEEEGDEPLIIEVPEGEGLGGD